MLEDIEPLGTVVDPGGAMLCSTPGKDIDMDSEALADTELLASSTWTELIPNE